MNTTYHPTVSVRTEKWIRFSAIAMMLLVAIAAVVLSFDGLRTLAVSNRVPEHLAFLFPIIIDGTITMSSLAILRMNLGGMKATFGWLVMFFGVGLSIAGNAISVRDAGVVAMLVHALPPILLAISLELLLSLIRASIKASREASMTEVEKPDEQTTREEETAPVEEFAPVSEPQPKATSPAVETPIKETVPVAISSVAVEHSSPTSPEVDSSVSVNPEISDIDNALTEEAPGGVESAGSHSYRSTPAAFPDSSLATQLEELSQADEQRQIAESFDQTLVIDDEGEAMDPVDDIVSPEAVEVGMGSSTIPENDTLTVNTEDLVAEYRKLVDGHDNWVRAKKIFVILMKYPEAQVNDIKRALGDKGNVSYKDDLVIARKNVEKARKKRENA